MKKLISVTAAGVAVPASLLAQVNFKDGAYRHTANDQVDISTGKIDLRREYSSRSYHRGIFGFGWCSVLEDRLNVDEIPVRASGCGDPTSDGIVFKDGRYLKFEHGKIKAEYDIYGQLQRIHGDNGGVLTLERDIGGKLRRLRTKNGEKIDVLWSGDETQVVGLRTPKSEFKFEYDNGDLVSWRKDKLKPNHYRYDDDHNLTAIHEEKNSVRIAYDAESDTVKEVSDGHCRRTFTYKKGQVADETAAVKVCNGQKPLQVSQRYEYRRSENGEEVLAKVRTIVGQRVSEVRLEGGRPVVIQRGSRGAKMKYAGNGDLTAVEIFINSRGEK